MPSPRIAIILYTVREAAQHDWRDTLKRVRDCGFQHVQWSGMPALPADEIRDALAAADLTAVAAHCPVEPWENDFDAQLAYWTALGLRDVAPGGMMDDCRDTREAFLAGAARLNTLGAKLLDQHVRLSYHNHAWEFEAFPGDDRTKFDLLYGSTDVEHLNVELDVAWAQSAGEDPARLLRQYARRCLLVHVKDFVWNAAGDAPTFVPLGRGIVDLEEVFAAAEDSGVEWLIYEQDDHTGDLWDNVRTSYRFLERAGFE